MARIIVNVLPSLSSCDEGRTNCSMKVFSVSRPQSLKRVGMRVCRLGMSGRGAMSSRPADGGDVVVVCCGAAGDGVFSAGGLGEVAGVSTSSVLGSKLRL